VQAPRVTLINGDLEVNGNISGAGIMLVTGRLHGTGQLNYTGLVLLIGAGDMGGGGLNLRVNGGVLVAHVFDTGASAVFGTPKFTVSGESMLLMNDAAIRMATRLIPPSQVSLREIRNGIDP
jgi:hypothetical protein